MRPAERRAHKRSLCAAAAALLPFVVPPLVRWLAEPSVAVLAAVTLLSAGVGAVGFFAAMLLWRPRCPRCRARARFVMIDGVERLQCRHCRYDEPTGYTSG